MLFRDIILYRNKFNKAKAIKVPFKLTLSLKKLNYYLSTYV